MALSECKSTSNEEKITFNGTKYVQTFVDDFDRDTLDDTKWEKCPEWQRQDLGGYWNDDCTHIENSNLVIEAKIKDSQYLSGAIRTKHRFYQGYGLYKIRFLAEKTSGCWYAFWLMSETQDNGNGAIDGAEIDIFEVISNDPNFPEGKKKYLNSAVHWDGYFENHKSTANQFFIDDDFYGKWHEITFEWTKDYYKAWLDDNETPYWDTTGKAKEYGGINTKENYVKISAEFGKWGGPVTEEVYPCHLLVDWVKIYKPE